MPVKVAINGFGRIGRNYLRAALNDAQFGKKYEIVAVNDLADPKTLCHLLKYDSVQGVLKEEVGASDKFIFVRSKEIRVLAEKNAVSLPWKELGVDIVVESTGLYTKKEDAISHLQAGAKKVLVSAPCKGSVRTVVMGVNEEAYDPTTDAVVSMASCTTNCLAPVAKTLDDNFKIKTGFMTTTHAYTNDQKILDLPHRDLRRARAAALSIIPTTTGAAAAIGDVIPALKGKLDGISLRVPVPCGSINDLTVELEKEVTRDEVNAAVKAAAQTPRLKGILAYTEEPIVSSDVIGRSESSIFDAQLTATVGGKGALVKTFSWYDNEWGYSNRLVDFTRYVIDRGI
ncbi:MAG: type I glyceraldehyde-3-phosphate dehydrogenase [Candidatus Micrarchaeota archaeon]